MEDHSYQVSIIVRHKGVRSCTCFLTTLSDPDVYELITGYKREKSVLGAVNILRYFSAYLKLCESLDLGKQIVNTRSTKFFRGESYMLEFQVSFDEHIQRKEITYIRYWFTPRNSPTFKRHFEGYSMSFLALTLATTAIAVEKRNANPLPRYPL